MAKFIKIVFSRTTWPNNAKHFRLKGFEVCLELYISLFVVRYGFSPTSFVLSPRTFCMLVESRNRKFYGICTKEYGTFEIHRNDRLR